MAKLLVYVGSFAYGLLSENVAHNKERGARDVSKSFAVFHNSDGEKFFADPADGIAYLNDHEGTMEVVIADSANDKAFSIHLVSQPRAAFLQAHDMQDPERILGRMIDMPRISPFGLLLGGLLMGRSGDDEDAAVCKPYIDALKDGDRIKFMPSNYRGTELVRELTVPEYRRLKELDMIDDCPVCTGRERRLVVHEEGDHTYESIIAFLDTEGQNSLNA